MKITEELLRKRSEHNDGILNDLQEIALHQFEIEKIELLGEFCKHLHILFLQNNIISRIGLLLFSLNSRSHASPTIVENLHKLKELEYLNLALNNIRKIENLEECESLSRLDLTANFITDLLSVASLRVNIHLKELFLVGNPCTTFFSCYRLFVIGALPQLVELDGQAITKTERILASQSFEQNRAIISSTPLEQIENATNSSISPESRAALYQEMAQKKQEIEEAKNSKPTTETAERQKRSMEIVFKEDGQVMQRNEGNWTFLMQSGWMNREPRQGEECIELDVSFPKFLDTSLIKIEPQPNYIRLIAKGKALVLNFPEEIKPDCGTADRSITTGHLLLKFPKVNQTLLINHQQPKVQKQPKIVPVTNSSQSTTTTSTITPTRTTSSSSSKPIKEHNLEEMPPLE